MTNLPPPEREEIIVGRTDLVPHDSVDKPSLWRRFIDGIRTVIGLKPLYLAEEWARAKVLEVETSAEKNTLDSQAKLLEAKAAYELAIAEARARTLGAEGQHAKDMAEAQLLETKSRLLASPEVQELSEQLIQGEDMEVADALDKLELLMQRILMNGGVVELAIPDLEEIEPPAPAPFDESTTWETEIDALQVSKRIRRILVRNGIQTILQLRQKTSDELLQLNGLGPASLESIQSALQLLGVSLSDHSEF